MKIQCPHCSYTREMDEARIPDGMLAARCPHCGKTFRFSKDDATKAQGGARAVSLAKLAARDRQKEALRTGDAGVPDWETRTGADRDTVRTEGNRGDEARPQVREMRTEESGDTSRGPGAERLQAGERLDEDGEEWSFNPWECARSLQEYVPAFYHTCLRVMFAPHRFFSGIAPRPALLALAFFLTVSVLQTVLVHLWGIIFLTYVMPPADTTDPQIKEFGELLAGGQGNFLFWLTLRCVMLLAQLYIFTGILCLCWRMLLRDRRVDFSVILQVLCYAEAPLVLSVIPGVGTIAGMLWSLVCTVAGCRAALRLSWAQTLLGVTPLFLLVLFSYMHFFSLTG